MRLPTKPWQLPTRTPTLRSCLASAMQPAITSAAVAFPLTISSSLIRFAGLKK